MGQNAESTTYGQRFKAARLAAGLTQIRLASLSGFQGEQISYGQRLISDIERGGPQGPSVSNRRRFGTVLGIDLEGNPVAKPEGVMYRLKGSTSNWTRLNFHTLYEMPHGEYEVMDHLGVVKFMTVGLARGGKMSIEIEPGP